MLNASKKPPARLLFWGAALLAGACASDATVVPGLSGAGGESAGGGALACGGGLVACGDLCVDARIDPENCGACDNACAEGEVCSQGQCSLACVGGTTKCGNTCTETDFDVANCGACANACSAANAVSSCASGVCAYSCKSDFGDCDQNSQNGCETNVTTSTSDCGACGKACAAGASCVLGTCQAPQSSALALATGANHTCALLSDGSVKCWGMNNLGQLGLGDAASRGDATNEMGGKLPAVKLGAGKTAKAITAGEGHTCALLSDGSVKCWGYNFYGQLGLGDTTNRGTAANQMGDTLPTVKLGTDKTAKAIAAGDSHTCALLNDDTVKCWGDNSYGRLGLGDNDWRGDAANEWATFSQRSRSVWARRPTPS